MSSDKDKNPPERRSGSDRRQGARRTGDRFAADGWRFVGGINRRSGTDRRSGNERRRGVEPES